MTIGEQLSQARKRQTLTQQQVAAVLHVTRQTISNWETGRSYPDIASLIACCRFYDLSLDHLLDEDGRLIDDLKQKEQERRRAKHMYWAAYTVNMLAMAAIALHLYHLPGTAMGIVPMILVLGILWVNLVVMAATSQRYRQVLQLPADTQKRQRVGYFLVIVGAAFVGGWAYAWFGWTPPFFMIVGVVVIGITVVALRLSKWR